MYFSSNIVNNSSICFGFDIPIVSHKLIVLIPKSYALLTYLSTFSYETFPSKGQPNVVAASNVIFISGKSAKIFSSSTKDSSTLRFTFALLCPSDTEITYAIFLSPISYALLTPL